METTSNPPVSRSSQTEQSAKPAFKSARHSGRWSGYQHLLWVRLLELKREPEIIFWVFGFPLLLSLGLGIAFRNQPVDQNPVAVMAEQNAEQIASRLGGSDADKRSPLRVVVVEREA